MPLNAISLYTGVGGLDFGFEAAGFRTAVAVEMDRPSCATMRLNRDWEVIESDIHAVSSETILEQAELKVGEADILIGGPPCQPFSKSGYWASGDALRLEDPRADTLTAYMRVLRDTLPRTFLLENVKGIAFTGKDEGIRYIERRLAEIEKTTGIPYEISVECLNAARYGIPQARERVFVIGNRLGNRFEFPIPTHAAPDSDDLLDYSLQPYISAWDAIGDLPQDVDDPALVVGGKWGALLPTIPEGRNYLHHTNRGEGVPLFGWRTRYWNFLLKLAKNLPAWTIQAQPGTATGPFHWRNRRLSPKELCRLQTFPNDLRFETSYREIHKMVGNAVPSLLAELLAREIRRQLLPTSEELPRAPMLRIERCDFTPDPEPIHAMPEQYLPLVGDHDDHPGEGRGPLYRERAARTLSG